MKWLLLLFAAYMLVLPCIPCNAAEVCCTEEDEICASAVSCSEGEYPCSEEEDSCPEKEHSCPDEKHVSSEEKHPCPEEEPGQHEHSSTCPCCPSFLCNTCHSIIVSDLVLEGPIIPFLSFGNIPFADEILSNFSTIIWQPPKYLC